MLEEYLCFLLTYAIGYLAGAISYKTPPDVTRITNDRFNKIYYKGKEVVKEMQKPKGMPTGQIKPKSVRDMQELHRPAKQKEGLEEMKKSLDLIGPLQEQKKLVEELRAQGIDPYG